MDSVKSRNVIHFTKSYEILQNILLDRGLRLKYCEEEFSFGKDIISAAVHPMVCFSAYEERDLVTTRSTYGRYAIAFSRDWALKNGAHEVLYLERNSVPAKALASLLNARQGKKGEFPMHLRLPVIQIKCFVKNASGPNRKANSKDFDFRSENEWRFVPSKDQIDGAMISQNKSYYQKRKQELNDQISKYLLRFRVSDIVRIYVDNDAESRQLAVRTGINIKLFAKSTWIYDPPKEGKK